MVVPANRIRTHLTEWKEVTEEDCREFAEEPAVRSQKSQPLRKASLSETGKLGFASADDDKSRRVQRLKADRDASVASGIQLLPVVILAEIFECLDTPIRCRYRNVCSHWNYVLSLPRIRNQLRLNFSGRDNSDEEVKEGWLEEEYLNAICVSKCWGPYIIITGFSDHHEPVPFSTRSFCRIVEKFELPSPRTILVSDQCWNGDEEDMGPVTKTSELLEICSTVILRNFRFSFVLSEDDNAEHKTVCKVRITTGRLAALRQLSGDDWCKMMFNGVPALTETQLTCVLDKLFAESFPDLDGSAKWEAIKQVLSEFLEENAEYKELRCNSQITLALQNASAKDLAKQELQKLPNFLQHCFLMAVQSHLLESTISW